MTGQHPSSPNQPATPTPGAPPAPSAAPSVDPVMAGLTGRCPRCGEGDLFAGFLALADQCESCELDYEFADAGDGPAVFVMLIVGVLVVAPALATQIAYAPPIWVQVPLWGGLGFLLSILLLRPFKGVMITLQYANNAREARLDLDGDAQGEPAKADHAAADQDQSNTP